MQRYRTKSSDLRLATMDDILRNMYDVGPSTVSESFEEMTLERFLAKAGAVREEDVVIGGNEIVPVDMSMPGYGDGGYGGSQGGMGYGRHGGLLEGRTGRGKRKVEEVVLVDKITLQRQKRMIKNRESAARSREKKQHYTEELEALVAQLEEENVHLQKHQEIQSKERLKQLFENLIPVDQKIPHEEKHKASSRVLRRVRSMEW